MSDIEKGEIPITPFMEKLFAEREEEKGAELSAFEKAHLKDSVPSVAPRTGTKQSVSARNLFNNGITGEAGKYKFEGLPFRGSPGNFKHDDPEHMQPQLSYEGNVKQFNLNDEKDMKDYNLLCQAVCDGSVMISFEDKIYDSEIKSWRILVRYANMFYKGPSQ